MLSDDELLERLKSVLAAGEAEPPAEDVAAVHQALGARSEPVVMLVLQPTGQQSEVKAKEKRRQPARPRLVLVPNGPREVRGRWNRRIAACGVAALSFSGVGTAAALGGAMPAPMRDMANAVGLPVDSADVHRARETMDELAEAIQRGDEHAASTHASTLRNRLDKLDGNERSVVSSDASALLDKASSLTGEPVVPVPATGTAAAAGTVADAGTGSPAGSAPGKGTDPAAGPTGAAGSGTGDPSAEVAAGIGTPSAGTAAAGEGSGVPPAAGGGTAGASAAQPTGDVPPATPPADPPGDGTAPATTAPPTVPPVSPPATESDSGKISIGPVVLPDIEQEQRKADTAGS